MKKLRSRYHTWTLRESTLLALCHLKWRHYGFYNQSSIFQPYRYPGPLGDKPKGLQLRFAWGNKDWLLTHI